jgi:hypothetical protein
VARHFGLTALGYLAIGRDNGERVRIAFTLDCCDREAISWAATTGSRQHREL